MIEALVSLASGICLPPFFDPGIGLACVSRPRPGAASVSRRSQCGVLVQDSRGSIAHGSCGAALSPVRLGALRRRERGRTGEDTPDAVDVVRDLHGQLAGRLEPPLLPDPLEELDPQRATVQVAFE